VKYYLHTSKMLSSYIHDRTGVLPSCGSVVTLAPIGRVTNTKPFSELCKDRAIELSKLVKDNDKKLSVFWSGGLDSTSVLLLLREQLPTNKIVVYYTEKSKEEYPGFFEKNIHNTFETKEFSMFTIWRAVEEAVKEGIVITGEISDQLFGSHTIREYSQEELKAPWQTCTKFNDIEHLAMFVEKCPRPISNVAELLWWVNYGLKYQWVQLRMLQDNNVTVLNENIIHFFDTPEFNDYSMSTDIEEKLPDFDFKQYKYPLREVIYSLSKDANYAFTKPKEDSWSPNYGKFARTRVATSIDTNWVRAYAGN